MPDLSTSPRTPDWIDDLTDEQCMEVFWLYVDPPEPFLQGYPPALLGQALRFALRAVARKYGGDAPASLPERDRD